MLDGLGGGVVDNGCESLSSEIIVLRIGLILDLIHAHLVDQDLVCEIHALAHGIHVILRIIGILMRLGLEV